MSELVIEFHWQNRYYGNPPTHELGFLGVDGYEVEDLTLIRSLDRAKDGEIQVSLDSITTFDTTEDEFKRWAWFLAQCMGWAAGFYGFPGTTRRDSGFGRRMHLITSVETHTEPREGG